MSDLTMLPESRAIEILAPILETCIRYLLCPMGLAEKGIRSLCHFILSKTYDERWILREKYTLRFKTEARPSLRYYVHIDDSLTFRIAGKAPVVLAIPECLSRDTARAILAAQHIDPWFADELVRRVEINWPKEGEQ